MLWQTYRETPKHILRPQRMVPTIPTNGVGADCISCHDLRPYISTVTSLYRVHRHIKDNYRKCVHTPSCRVNHHAESTIMPCQPSCRVNHHAVSTIMPCQPSCRVNHHAVPTIMPCQPSCRVNHHAVSTIMPCQPSCRVNHHAVSTIMPCPPSCRVNHHAVSTIMPCQPSCRVNHHAVSSDSRAPLALNSTIFAIILLVKHTCYQVHYKSRQLH